MVSSTSLSILSWKIPWTEEPGGLQSMGSRRVGHDWVTSLSLFTFMHWRMKWQPTPVFLPGESQGRGAWWAAVSGVAQSRTRLKRLSSSSTSLDTLVILLLNLKPEQIKNKSCIILPTKFYRAQFRKQVTTLKSNILWEKFYKNQIFSDCWK